jgi:hypothetical protein
VMTATRPRKASIPEPYPRTRLLARRSTGSVTSRPAEASDYA